MIVWSNNWFEIVEHQTDILGGRLLILVAAIYNLHGRMVKCDYILHISQLKLFITKFKIIQHQILNI